MTTIRRIGGNEHSANRATRERPANQRRILQATWTVIGLLAAVLVAFPDAQVERAGRKVSGFVVAAATQQPVANASVRYEETGQPAQTTVTDGKGYVAVKVPCAPIRAAESWPVVEGLLEWCSQEQAEVEGGTP